MDFLFSDVLKDLNVSPINHLGIVCTFIKDTKLIETIDSAIPTSCNSDEEDDDNGHLTHGQIVALMLVESFVDNSLVGYRLDLFDMDFKPLLGFKCEEDWFTEEVKSNTLDALNEFGLTKIYSALSAKILNYIKREIGTVSLDTLSFIFLDNDNYYANIGFRFGNAADFFDYKSYVAEGLLIDAETGVPIYIEPENGNSYSAGSFAKMIEVFKNYKQENKNGQVYFRSYDDFYNADSLQTLQNLGIKYISKRLGLNNPIVEKFILEHKNDKLQKIDNSNKGLIYDVEHEGVKQKWLLVYSSANEEISSRAVDKSLQTETKNLTKKIKEFEDKAFASEEAAQKALQKFEKSCKFCKIKTRKILEKKNLDGGKNEFNYFLHITIETNSKYCKEAKENKCFYVVATNDIERDWIVKEFFKEASSQNKVSRGFRFTRALWFQTDLLLVEEPERARSLMMIKILELAIFNALEWKMQNAMIKSKQQFYDYKNKLQDKISLSEVFSCFGWINSVIKEKKRHVYPLGRKQIDILSILGKSYEKAYCVSKSK